MQASSAANEGQSYQPAIIVCAACIAGVVLDRWLAPGPLVWITATLAGFAFWCVAFRRRAVSPGAFTILLAVLATAGLWHHVRWRIFPASDVGFIHSAKSQAICLEGWAYTPPRHHVAPTPDPLSTVPVSDESRFTIAVERVRDGRDWRAASGCIPVSVKGYLTDLCCGDRVRIYGTLSTPPEPLNPGERSVRDYERVERRLCRLHANLTDCVHVVQRGVRWRPTFWMHWLRDRFDGYLRKYVSNARAGLSCAILLGTREDVDRQRNEEFMTTGTVHLLAISGLNVGILAYAFWIAGRLGLVSRASTLFGGILFVIWYALLTDAQPPVIRAAVLVTVMCVARLFGRQSLNFNTLAVAAIVVLIINPASIFLVGTQLSFLAVATMACVPTLIPGADRIDDPLQQLIRESRSWPERWLRRSASMVWQAMVLSTVIWLISLPLVMYRFHVVSPIATVLNPVVCLPMALALFAGFGVMIFGWFAPPAAAICGWLCDESLRVMEYCIDQALRIPGNHFWGPAPPAWWVALFYAGLAIHHSSQRFQMPQRWSCALMAAWFGLGAWLTLGPGARFDATTQDRLRCTFISVGHGTSVLLELPDGRTLLYDAGKLGYSHTGGQTISSVLWSRHLTHLDAIVISHADADHFNAVPYLLERFSVGAIYCSPTMFRSSQTAVDALAHDLKRRYDDVRFLSNGDRLDTPIDLRILHPPPSGISGSDNANSIVLIVEFENRRLLLPGDLESPGTEQLLALPTIDCDVLMAPHHGSLHSNPEGFTDWSMPEIVVISGAAKRDPRALIGEYESAGARVFHTAFDGAVQISLGRGGVTVDTFR